MRTVFVLMFLAVPAFAQYPPGVAVKVSEYVLVDGRRVGIAEWSDMLAAVPCEVQANVPKAAPKCRACGEGCDCGPGCACDAKAAERAAKVERPRQPAPVESAAQRSARLNAVPVRTPMVDAYGRLIYRDWTLGEFIAAGGNAGTLRDAHGWLGDADRAFLSTAPARAEHPVAVPAYYAPPTYSPGFSAGFQFRGPFGGSVGGQVCLPGGA